MATRMQQRRGTAAQWTAASPILAAGEIGFETDTGKFKIGDGTNVWSSLSYFTDSQDFDTSNFVLNTQKGAAGGVATLNSNGHVPINQLGALIDNAPAALDTLHELADALTAIDNAVGAHAGLSTNIHGIVDTAELATKDYADNSVLTHNNVTLNVHGIANTGDLTTTTYVHDYVNNAVAAHDDITENVHGIADTSLLATKAYADSSSSDARIAAEGFSTSSLEAHNLDTINVHGIANTADLATTSYVDSAALDAVADAALDATTKANGAEAAAIAAAALDATAKADAAEVDAKAYTDAEIDAHVLVTQNVHGIADTTALALTADVNAALDLKQDKVTGVSDTEIGYLDGVTSAIQTQLNSKAASLDVSSHTSATTSVHGISDTSQLAYKNAANQTFTGNLEVDGNMTVDGNLTVNGTTFNASATSITIEDNLVQLAHQNAANTVDLGVVVAYNDGSAKHAGIVRDVSDSKWKIFKDVTDEPATTVNFGQGSLDNLAVNNVEVAGVVFSDGTQTKEGVVSRTPIIQKTASYTLSALTERDNMIEFGSGSAMTLTIPADSTLNFPIGTSLDILQTSSGQVTVAGAGGVTVNATPGLKLRGQWSGATLFKRAANTWVVYGDLSA